ncbi:hypothetical protein [Pelomonas sp. SE-A7]|uniref:hypothetical protein n=1 Tax=Pelomonas sp. SE-A7 TaxID=3054953 RepID=UPI00259D1BC6|nr:hypothetical protein [Pelomonas sp. SE-A7]MDM4766269.1 hypothetical protein [Pelomonas sp. SE-A7]
MQRRGLLKLGLGAAVVLGLAGTGAALLLKPGLVDGGRKLSPAGRAVFAAVARAVFDGGLMKAEDTARLNAFLDRVDASIAGLPDAVRAELSQLLSLLDTSAGRYALIGLKTDWAKASTAELAEVLEALRLSGSQTRQQVYHALRDLSSVAFFTDPANWSLAGYPGPREIP